MGTTFPPRFRWICYISLDDRQLPGAFGIGASQGWTVDTVKGNQFATCIESTSLAPLRYSPPSTACLSFGGVSTRKTGCAGSW